MSEQDNGCAVEELSEIERHIKGLETEVETLTKAGIIEVAVRNPSVMEYMKHWEGRAEKAEAEITRLTTALEKARKDAWQPIETAPRDGTLVLVAEQGFVEISHWHVWRLVRPAGASGVGAWVAPKSFPEEEYEIFQPTHWQPLPEPPVLTPPKEKAT